MVLYLSGGNDALSMLIPYNDTFYYSRRPTLAVPAGNVLQIGTDSSRVALGLHPRLTGLKADLRPRAARVHPADRLQNQSRSHFQRHRHLVDGQSRAIRRVSAGSGRYLDSLPSPVDPLVGWNTTGDLPHVLQACHVAVPAIPNRGTYAFPSPNARRRSGGRAGDGAAHQHPRAGRSARAGVRLRHVAGGAWRRSTAWRRWLPTRPTVTYPEHRLRSGPPGGGRRDGARASGREVFYVTTGGFDTHSAQNVNATNGAYFKLMATLNDGLLAFYNDLKNQGLLEDTLVLTFSEFGRRITENGSAAGTDHGAASVMMAMGGRVNGGLYGTAPTLNTDPTNPTLENNANDVRYETDFRSVYAQVIDGWLGADSRALLNGDFRKSSLAFI